jgi:hypothetical protein
MILGFFAFLAVTVDPDYARPLLIVKKDQSDSITFQFDSLPAFPEIQLVEGTLPFSACVVSNARRALTVFVQRG